jgi:hypothetical protein
MLSGIRTAIATGYRTHNRSISFKVGLRGVAFRSESGGNCYTRARHSILRRLFAILEVGVAKGGIRKQRIETSGIRKQRFGFGPGARTSFSSATTAPWAFSVAASRAVCPDCPAHQGPIMSEQASAPDILKELNPPVLSQNHLRKPSGVNTT